VIGDLGPDALDVSRDQFHDLLAGRRSSLKAALMERDSIPRGRIPPEPGWLTGARDERPGSCPRCKTSLKRGTIAGRTTCWCPRRQRR